MLSIKKITSDSVIDFAAEELKKYLRMMMPEGGDIKISYEPCAKDGFRLGLMQDLGLDISDAEDTALDDIMYIDCLEDGGIIAGDNARSVLLAVYEYLRRNGCRWLFPGVDGEYIPVKEQKPCLVMALGYPSEKVYITDAKNRDIKYYRDDNDNHAVPKLSLEELVLN